jgi:hypothetical protein
MSPRITAPINPCGDAQGQHDEGGIQIEDELEHETACTTNTDPDNPSSTTYNHCFHEELQYDAGTTCTERPFQSYFTSAIPDRGKHKHGNARSAYQNSHNGPKGQRESGPW